MAFLHHHPRRGARMQQSSSPSTASLSQSAQSIHGAHEEHDSLGEVKDWSIVFPGRARQDGPTAGTATPSTPPITSPSPFISPPDDDVDGSNVELTLPHEQDGTGRFTRPSSPYYAADDEGEEDEEDAAEDRGEEELGRAIGPPTVDSISEGDSELDGVEMASSIFFSGSEMGRKDSSPSQRRQSGWESGADLPSSSWAWMNAESSYRSHRGRTQPSLPVVFTSGSEGEGDDMRVSTQSVREEEAAFEDALANTHLAQSAGLMARVPKRRHRKMGESAKGSKRSNSSAVVASEMQSSRRRSGLSSRKGRLSSYSARSASRSKPADKSMAEEAVNSGGDSRVHKLVDVILRKLFRVDDDEVLQAFLRDEGPLKVVDDLHYAGDASSALHAVGRDEVWSRTERNRQLRQSRDKSDADEQWHQSPQELIKLPTQSMHAGQMFASPPRIRLDSHVGEPSLLEAIQASVLSSLSVVPSGLSLLLAGSRSVRLVSYLAGQIGPSLTERVRKLIDDAEDDTSIPDDDIGMGPTRFRGGSHPAISSHSSTTLTSRVSS